MRAVSCSSAKRRCSFSHRPHAALPSSWPKERQNTPTSTCIGLQHSLTITVTRVGDSWPCRRQKDIKRSAKPSSSSSQQRMVPPLPSFAGSRTRGKLKSEQRGAQWSRIARRCERTLPGRESGLVQTRADWSQPPETAALTVGLRQRNSTHATANGIPQD